MGYEYKCVAAPEKAKRHRDARTKTERAALALQDLINEHAVDGWDFVRTDLVPISEGGWLGRSQEVHRAVLIFRREILQLRPDQATSLGRQGDRLAADR